MDHAEELLARIRADKIRPIPVWRVRLARVGILALFVAVVLLGTLSVAVALQELHAHAGRGWMFRRIVADWAPFLWGATFLVFLWAGVRLFRELPRGWRVRPWQVAIGVGVVSIVGGWTIERMDALMAVHHAVVRNVPSYREAWQGKAMREWHDPKGGRISGYWSVASDSAGTLVDVEGLVWMIKWKGESDALPPTGGVRLMGGVCGERVFCADDWRPVPGAGRNHRMR